MHSRSPTALHSFPLRYPVASAAVILILWLIVLSPAALLDLTLDDLLHRRELLTGDGHWWRNLFVFLTGEAAATLPRVATDALPWWTDPAVRIAFFRPLSSLTHWLDHRLWPDSAQLIHLHSILWYGVLCGLLFACYRRLLPPAVALLGWLLFLVDVQHLVAIGWVANRNSLIATSFSVLAILLHWVGIERQRPMLAWLAALALLLALLAGEMGAGSAGYLLGCTLFFDRRPWSARFLSLLPFALTGGGWLAFYVYSGFGTAHTGFYGGFTSGDPVESLSRLPFLAALFVSGVPGQFWPQQLSGVAAVAWLPIAFFLVAAAWLLYPVVKTSAVARCLLFGVLVSLLPISNSFATERNLMLAGVGGHALLALVLVHWWQGRRRGGNNDKGWRMRLRGALCWSLATVHLVLSPLAVMGVNAGFVKASSSNSYAMARTSEFDNGGTAVVLQVPSAIVMPTVVLQRQYLGLPVTDAAYVLAVADADVRVERLDAQTVRVTLAAVLNNVAGRYGLIFRDFHGRPLQAGDVIERGDIQVTIERVAPNGMPDQYQVHFNQPLEHYQWLNWRREDKKLVKVPSP